MRVAIMGDTHLPSRAEGLPEWVIGAVEASDHVIHTGDFDSRAAFEEAKKLAQDLTAVAGNMDPASLGLPPVETVSLGGVEFVVTHGTGPPEGYEDRVETTVTEHASTDVPTVGVAGHTHEVLDRKLGGHRVLNPGSATGAAPAARTSMMIADITGEGLSVELREE